MLQDEIAEDKIHRVRSHTGEIGPVAAQPKDVFLCGVYPPSTREHFMRDVESIDTFKTLGKTRGHASCAAAKLQHTLAGCRQIAACQNRNDQSLEIFLS